MTIITKTIICPEIKQLFNPKLLQYPRLKFCDDKETLWNIFLYIDNNLSRKSKYGNREGKYKKLKEEFFKIYEQITEKEKNEGQDKDKNNRLFYYVNLPYRGGQNLFNRLRQKRYHRIFE